MSELSQEQLLDILRASSDSSYIEPLETEDNGAGFDVFRAIAAMLARASTAVEVSQQSFYVWPHSEQTHPPASGGVQATGILTITRDAPAESEITIPEGEKLLVMLLGLDGNQIVECELEVTTATVFASGNAGPVAVPVRATRIGFHGNRQASSGRFVVLRQKTTKTLPGCSTTAANRVADTDSGDTFDAGDIGCWLRFTAGPNVGLGTRYIIDCDESTNAVTVSGAALIASPPTSDCEVVDLERLGFHAVIYGALSGGRAATLDMYGKDKNIRRNIGETDTSYRERVLRLPDVVSPEAVQRAIGRILNPLGIVWRFIESRNSNHISGAAYYQAAYDVSEAKNWILGAVPFFYQGDGFEHRGFYVVVEFRDDGDPGWPYDRVLPLPNGHPSNAYDGPAAYDGAPFGWNREMRALCSEVRDAREAGVPWLLVICEQIP